MACTQITSVVRTMKVKAENRIKAVEIVCMAGILILAAGHLSAGENVPLNKLAQYYSARASVEKQYGMFDNYKEDKAIHDFINDRKAQLQSALDTKAETMELEAANKIALNYYRNCSRGKAKTPDQGDQADSPRYIDVKTGHLYVKRPDGKYDEFTRKGTFFKTVSPKLPLLLRGESVYPIPSKSYLLYSQKRHLPDGKFQALPSEAPHPKGWFLETVLVGLTDK